MITQFSQPIEVSLPGYRCKHRVLGIERKRNHGPMLTMAVAEWQISGQWHAVRDIVSCMRLADVVSDRHELPINADRLYGPSGRMSPIGRK